MSKSQARTLQDFKAAFDRNTRTRIRLRAALEELSKLGPEEWRNERELCSMAKISTNDLPELREEFAKHIVLVDGGRDKRAIWFADPKAAAKVRQ